MTRPTRLLRVCPLCDGRVQLVSESYDAPTRLYIGALQCVACAAWFLDRRREDERRC